MPLALIVSFVLWLAVTFCAASSYAGWGVWWRRVAFAPVRHAGAPAGPWLTSCPWYGRPVPAAAASWWGRSRTGWAEAPAPPGTFWWTGSSPQPKQSLHTRPGSADARSHHRPLQKERTLSERCIYWNWMSVCVWDVSQHQELHRHSMPHRQESSRQEMDATVTSIIIRTSAHNTTAKSTQALCSQLELPASFASLFSTHTAPCAQTGEIGQMSPPPEKKFWRGHSVVRV